MHKRDFYQFIELASGVRLRWYQRLYIHLYDMWCRLRRKPNPMSPVYELCEQIYSSPERLAEFLVRNGIGRR